MPDITQYNVKRIFIASPGDLNDERKIFYDVISEVNFIKAHSMGIHLEPLGWEDTLPGKGRPQELINKDLARCDLFSMMLWKRWGTPTGKFSSGTEEEFYVASNLNSQSNKPEIWLFFKSIEPDKEGDNKDINRIVEFKKNIQNQNAYLWKCFDTQLEWEQKFRKYLCLWLDNVSVDILDRGEVNNIIGLENILMEITFVDRSHGNSKNEIYFTISDDNSMECWNKLNETQKKSYLYKQLSQYLYLNLGVNQYKAIMRYRMDMHKFILLGLITFKYSDKFENSNFYIPPELNQVVYQVEPEMSLMELHALFGKIKADSESIPQNSKSPKVRLVEIKGLYIKNDRTYIPLAYIADLLEIKDDNSIWSQIEGLLTLTLIKNDRVVHLMLSRNLVKINGVNFETDIEPLIIENGVPYLLLKVVAQAFGLSVEFDSNKMEVKLIWPD